MVPQEPTRWRETDGDEDRAAKDARAAESTPQEQDVDKEDEEEKEAVEIQGNETEQDDSTDSSGSNTDEDSETDAYSEDDVMDRQLTGYELRKLPKKKLRFLEKTQVHDSWFALRGSREWIPGETDTDDYVSDWDEDETDTAFEPNQQRRPERLRKVLKRKTPFEQGKEQRARKRARLDVSDSGSSESDSGVSEPSGSDEGSDASAESGEKKEDDQDTQSEEENGLLRDSVATDNVHNFLDVVCETEALGNFLGIDPWEEFKERVRTDLDCEEGKSAVEQFLRNVTEIKEPLRAIFPGTSSIDRLEKFREWVDKTIAEKMAKDAGDERAGEQEQCLSSTINGSENIHSDPRPQISRPQVTRPHEAKSQDPAAQDPRPETPKPQISRPEEASGVSSRVQKVQPERIVLVITRKKKDVKDLGSGQYSVEKRVGEHEETPDALDELDKTHDGDNRAGDREDANTWCAEGSDAGLPRPGHEASNAPGDDSERDKGADVFLSERHDAGLNTRCGQGPNQGLPAGREVTKAPKADSEPGETEGVLPLEGDSAGVNAPGGKDPDSGLPPAVPEANKAPDTDIERERAARPDGDGSSRQRELKQRLAELRAEEDALYERLEALRRKQVETLRALEDDRVMRAQHET